MAMIKMQWLQSMKAFDLTKKKCENLMPIREINLVVNSQQREEQLMNDALFMVTKGLTSIIMRFTDNKHKKLEEQQITGFADLVS